jgi:hypothetical protein
MQETFGIYTAAKAAMIADLRQSCLSEREKPDNLKKFRRKIPVR